MNAIRITHNPFTVKTTFHFGESSIPSGCSLDRFSDLRLQRWVDKLFPELYQIFNGRKQLEVTFVGIETDYLDVKEAARIARQAGATIDLTWVENAPAEARWSELQGLLDEVTENSRYRSLIENDTTVQGLLQDAKDRDFDVHVVATMSSGKSTLINAMLGCDLLPAGNEATTATITRIYDNDSSEPGVFTAERIHADGSLLDRKEVMDLDTMREWNRFGDTHQIRLEGNILAVKERPEVRLVLSDTPGPNNGADGGLHRRATLNYVQDTQRCPMVLYVMNAAQMGVNDDKDLINLVATTMRAGGRQNSDRFIFVLNKMDGLDEERGDDAERMLQKAKEYLGEQGIPDPQVFPASANFARLLRHGGALSKKERIDLAGMRELFHDGGLKLPLGPNLPRHAQESLIHRALSDVEVGTGVPAIESMIDAYIGKYHLPHRLERAGAALKRVISLVVNEAQLTAELDKGESELSVMREEISRLKARSESGLGMQVYEDRVRRESVSLPDEVTQALEERRVQIATLRRALGEEFTGSVTPRKAEEKVEEVRSTLQFRFDELINAYEAAFVLSQELIKLDLEEQYRKYVDLVFEGADSVTFPVLERLKDRVSDFSLSLGLTEEDIKTRKEQTGTRRVDTSTWWKPWTWNDGYDVAIMKDVSYVDLNEFFKDHIVGQMAMFTKLDLDARAVIEKGREALVASFLGFIAGDFMPRLDELVEQLYKRIDEAKERQAAVIEAKEALAWVRDVQGRIDALFFVGAPKAEEFA